MSPSAKRLSLSAWETYAVWDTARRQGVLLSPFQVETRSSCKVCHANAVPELLLDTTFL